MKNQVFHSVYRFLGVRLLYPFLAGLKDRPFPETFFARLLMALTSYP